LRWGIPGILIIICADCEPSARCAAKRVREDILDAIRRLVPFPHQGHQRRDLASRPVRFQTVRNYLIAYAPDEEPLLVLAVLDGRRSPRVLAAILRGRK
jgi:plasmid stabilization system protein ParE